MLGIDKLLYDSCRDYADRLIQQKLSKQVDSTCEGFDGIRELCKKCPYFVFSEAACRETK